MALPFSSLSSAALDDFMSRPSEGALAALETCHEDVAVLGANGKMGLHLCLMLKKGFEKIGRPNRQVLAISRFGSEGAREKFEEHGLRVIPADLSDPEQLNQLPEVPDAFFLAGVKFGTAQDPELLHRMNIEMPRLVAERYRDSRIVALSTGCVYSYVSPESGGSVEEDATDPVGEYAQSCLGRELAFTEAGKTSGTQCALIRLNYAIDLRYGVLVDIAQKVLAGQPVDVTMGHVNVIWQSDALAYTIQALPHVSAPPFLLNVTGPGILRIRELAERFGEFFEQEPIIIGEESETTWLNNASRAHESFGPPTVSLDEMIEWIATWLTEGGETLGKPTHFETRDGKY